MRNHDTLTKALIVLSSFFVLSCQHVELPETQQHKIVASVGAYNTKANFHMTETPNVLCEWNGRETLRVYYKRSNGKYHSTFANAPVARVEEEGKSADFTFSPEQAWGFNGNVSSYPVAIFTVNCFPTIDPEDGSIYLDARLVRQPLKDFELPVYYVGEVVNGTVEATFSHYYAYEFLHVKNTSDKTIEFSLNGYETPWIWYKKLASVGLEDGVVYNKSWSGLTPAEVSYPVSIAPGSSDIIVSAYIPNDFIVKDAAIVAAIDGIIVKSTNKKSSAAPLVPGRAYHMYAGWNGQELRFWDDGEEPLDVRTLTASIDPQYLSGEFTGVVANPPMSEIKTGFRFWKENNPEDYVEYDSTSSDNGSFSLNLKYDDFVYIANESPVEGKYFVSAFAIDAKGTRHPGNVLEFTIESGQPVVPEAVDLGLSVKWASFNVGATKPEEYGGHYAWGEIEEKTAYDWSTYKWSDGDSNRLIKYCTESTDGHIDGKTTLDLDDDVAHVCFGDNWRMPTKSELDELIQKCTWRWTTKNGVSGYEVTGANGNSVFLPSAGVRDNSNHGGTDPLTGQYWSSTLCDEMTSIDSHYLYCGSNDYLLSDASRYRGLSVRPVYDDSDQKPEIKTPEIVDLGLSVKWASFNLGASAPEEYGDYFAWGETEPYYTNGHAYDNPCTDWMEGKSAGYFWPSYKWCEGTHETITKTTDLELEDDAAHLSLGDKWRMPTLSEMMELAEECFGKCTWTWMSENGVNGYKITSNVSGFEGNSIFLPAAGWRREVSLVGGNICGGYWTSSYDYWNPAEVDFNHGYRKVDNYFNQSMGFAIRPVYGDPPSTQPEIEIIPKEIEFGEVPYGTSSTKYVTVKNVGTGVLLFAVSTDVNVPFSVETKPDGTPKCYSLAEGESIQLSFTYTPTSASSSAAGSCFISSNTTVLNESISYSGLGVGPETLSREYVDLGLSVKWATCNLGATKPEEFGDYYAWGETETKVNNDWSAYKWSDGSGTYAKYNALDNNAILDFEDDVAHTKLGENWRMPTYDEFSELLEKCSWNLTYENGVMGYKVTSTIEGYTDKYIFLRTAGWCNGNELIGANELGNYWSSSLYSNSDAAWCLLLNSVGGHLSKEVRYYGLSIRPVYVVSEMPEIEVSPTDIEFGAVPYGTSSTKYVTVKNIGSGVLSFTVENVSAPFSVTPTSYSLSAGESVQLAFTYTPVSATSGAGGRCTIVSNATQSVVSVTYSGSGTESGVSTPEAIDLGLPSGLKWASFNLGASKPEEYGDYYAWGETEPYYSSLDPLAWKPGKESGYTWSSYRWSVDGYSLYSLIKYCTNPDYNDEGFTDGKTVLEPDDDAAHVNLGGGWRMPTREEYDELIKECTWEKTTVDGISVRKITGPSGKYILLPVAGSWNGTGLGGLNSYGYYWSSSVDAQDPGNAYCICIMPNNVSESRNSRCGGFPVRPVCD